MPLPGHLAQAQTAEAALVEQLEGRRDDGPPAASCVSREGALRTETPGTLMA